MVLAVLLAMSGQVREATSNQHGRSAPGASATGGLLLVYRGLMDEVCEYSLRHNDERVPATTTIEVPGIGQVPACEPCFTFYERQGGSSSPTTAIPALAVRRLRNTP